jgi:glucose-6-phosphate dehydrogenase assembly protein OpcA
VAEAVVLDRWHGSDVRLSEVVDNLIELRHTAARTASRTSVMTLVIVAVTDDEAYRAQMAMHALGSHHPARLIILRPEPGPGPAGVDARVTIYGAVVGEHPVAFDEVILAARSDAAAHLRAIIEPFTLPDLPIVLWYPGEIPTPTDSLLGISDTVLVDSKEAGDERAFVALAELSRHGVVVDLSWERLRPWRELLAALFTGPVYRPFAAGVTDIEVAGKRGPRHLLAGWLASRLGTPRAHIHLTDDRHVQVVLHAGAGGHRARFELSRGEGERLVQASVTVEGGPHHAEVLALPDDSLSWSLAQALTHLRRDPVWERALAASVVLGQ